jgi:hypothetical protein
MISRLAPIALLALSLAACGSSKKPAEQADNSGDDGGESSGGSDLKTTDGGADPITGDKPAESKPCEGFEIADLAKVLGQAACEVPNPKPEDKAVDVKGKLEIKLLASPNTVTPGGKVDLLLTIKNVHTASIPLLFTVDPEPRFVIEVYDAKGKRAEIPAGAEPALPASVQSAPVPEKKTAKATLVTQGTAQIKLDWEAVKYKWAPAERAKGAVPGRGYPRVTDKPLPKGKYTIRVRMPLIGVFEGIDHEVSEPRVQIEVK